MAAPRERPLDARAAAWLYLAPAFSLHSCCTHVQLSCCHNTLTTLRPPSTNSAQLVAGGPQAHCFRVHSWRAERFSHSCQLSSKIDFKVRKSSKMAKFGKVQKVWNPHSLSPNSYAYHQSSSRMFLLYVYKSSQKFA